MRRNIFCGTLIVIALALVTPPTIPHVSAQTNASPATPGAMAGMPSLQQEELTIDLAKAGVDSFLALKKEFGGEDLPRLNSSQEIGAPQALQRYAGFQNTVKSYGFDNVSQWHRVVLSLFLAHDFNKEGKLEEFQQSIDQMKQTDLPEQTQQQMIAMMNRLKPSENNLAVARALIEDAEYGPKLKKMQD